jgi:hypothetical protein
MRTRAAIKAIRRPQDGEELIPAQSNVAICGPICGPKQCQTRNKLNLFTKYHGDGGDGGIRTLDRALQPYNGLANRRLQPLGHVSRRNATYARRIPPLQALRCRSAWRDLDRKACSRGRRRKRQPPPKASVEIKPISRATADAIREGPQCPIVRQTVSQWT